MTHLQAGVLIVEVGILAVVALIGGFWPAGPWRRRP